MQWSPSFRGHPYSGILGRWGGTKYNKLNPTAYDGLAAWYDVSDYSSLVVDGSNRVSLVADKSGNSAVNCLCLNGASGNFASIPDAANLSGFTAGITMTVRVRLPDYTPAANMVFLAKDDVTTREYGFRLQTSGEISAYADPSGTFVGHEYTSTGAALTDGQVYWLKASKDLSTGLWSFFKQNDTGSNVRPSSGWTAIGTAASNSGTLSSGASPLYFGIINAASNPLAGNLFYASLNNGVDNGGTDIAVVDFSTFSKLASSGTATTGQTVTINSSGDLGARISGERDLVQFSAAKQPIYYPPVGPNTSLYVSNFSAGADGFAGNLANNTHTGNVDANADGAGVPPSNDWLRVQKTVASGDSDTRKSTGAVPYFANEPIRVTGKVFAPASFTASRFLSVRANAFGANSGAVLAAIVPGSEVTFDVTVTPTVFSDTIILQITDATGTTANIASGDAWYVKDLTVTLVNSRQAFILLDGSDDYMKAAAFSLSQPESVYFVGQQVSWTSGDVLFDGSIADSMEFYQGGSTPNIILWAGSNGPSVNGLPLGNTGILSGTFNAASSTLRLNRGTASTGNAGTRNANGFTLGSNTVGSFPANIRFNEAIIRSAADATAVQDRFALYSGAKWGFST